MHSEKEKHASALLSNEEEERRACIFTLQSIPFPNHNHHYYYNNQLQNT